MLPMRCGRTSTGSLIHFSLSSTTVIEAERVKSLKTGSAVVYFYCETAQREMLKASSVFESLSKQLLMFLALIRRARPLAIREQINKLYETHEIAPDLDDVVHIFSMLFDYVNHATYIIDGLDELEDREASKVLRVFRGLFTDCQDKKLLLSSRTEVDCNINVINSIPGTMHIPISTTDVEKDIQFYIDSTLQIKMSHDRKLTDNPRLVQEIKDSLISGAKGM